MSENIKTVKIKDKEYNYSSEKITKLEEGEVFVFGSNKSGIHGAGAAYIARKNFGAVLGVGVGASGSSYAIPTKDKKLKTMSIFEIDVYVEDFIFFCQLEENKHKKFLVTEIGCGLAGFELEDIAPLFLKVVNKKIGNIFLPKKFLEVILKCQNQQ